ncbi:hypothetical protein [Ferrimonas balearica]|uniref:hypothetical protein n=1 Tax=Ferrimonas balearica TaxID=44012 RepID=UPI001C99127F|nr:hypothetical protein [Ferrimonas balearica]MBY5920222.1 hypothetical protein [Ferrimonas balearica]MBY5997093.1 hypothetical protein [Ferrimonas balearica]
MKIVLTTLLLLSVSLGAAEHPIQPLSLEGDGKVSVQGRLKGYELMEYRVSLCQGQRWSVVLDSDNRFQYFNVTGPNQDTALFIGSTSGTEYEGEAAMDGEYRILTYLMRNAARRDEVGRYTLTIEHLGPPTGPNLPDP